MRSTVKCVLASSLAVLMGGFTHANAAVFEGHPDVITCELGGGVGSPGTMVFYVEGRDNAGIVYYRSANRQMSLKVDRNDIVRPDVSGPNSCIGKSLKELSEQQNTFNFTKS